MAESLFSPKAVANALGVSESSLKRWCDRGTIETTKTAGGHRRIPKSAILNFIRESEYRLAQPEIIGLPKLTLSKPLDLGQARDQLLAALLQGDEAAARETIIQMYLDGQRISAIGDHVLAPVFHEIGDRWQCSKIEIYQERLSCEIGTRLLYELRSLLRPAPPHAPVAIGATPECDPYSLPTLMVEMVLTQNGYRAVSLGTCIPLSSMMAALRNIQPNLFWYSVSVLDNEAAFLAEYRQLYDEFGHQIPIVVGGRALSEPVRKQMQYAVYCDQLEHLDSFLHSVMTSGRTTSAPRQPRNDASA